MAQAEAARLALGPRMQEASCEYRTTEEVCNGSSRAGAGLIFRLSSQAQVWRGARSERSEAGAPEDVGAGSRRDRKGLSQAGELGGLTQVGRGGRRQATCPLRTQGCHGVC